MPTIYEFEEQQTGTFTGVLKDEFGGSIGSSDVTSLTLTITDQITKTIINNRFRQTVLNDNNVTLDNAGNLSWSIQALDNIIVGEEAVPGTVERHEVLFEWTWGASKYSNELYYFDITQLSEIGDSGGNIYGTVLDATNYFTNRLNSTAWTNASNSERVAALIEAARLIDNLNFKGDKTVSGQYLEFPRGGDTVVPRNIMYASYELAIKLLDGFDPDNEMESLRSESQQYDGVRESYQRGVFPEWTMAGIISARAWRLLKPYLRDPKILTMTRES